ncbi:hypothetical protein LSUE1_G007864, partial [Lachnellula suecica]
GELFVKVFPGRGGYVHFKSGGGSVGLFRSDPAPPSRPAISPRQHRTTKSTSILTFIVSSRLNIFPLFHLNVDIDMEAGFCTQPNNANANANASPPLPVTLRQLLSSTLVLYQTAPYLPVSSLLALGATSKPFKTLIHNTPGVFRHLDLTQTKSAQFQIAPIDHGGEVWRNVQLDENVTEDDFYGGPLRGIFSNLRRQHILKDVQTLVLDGLSVTADLVSEIICHDSFNVRILSIREAQNLNERKLQQALNYAVRPSRPPNSPKLEALYFFGPKDATSSSRFRRHANKHPSAIVPAEPSYGGVMNSLGAQIGAQWNERSGDTLADEMERNGDKWYQHSGKVIAKPPSSEWAETLKACQGIISFDAVLCRGPRHSELTPDTKSTIWYKRQDAHLPPRIATHAVKGCCKCGTTTEGFAHFGASPLDQFPLLAPPPLHASTAKAAKAPSCEDTSSKKLLVRCIDCLRVRFCETCHKWWCEDCYEASGLPVNFSPTIAPWESVGSTAGQLENNVKVHMGLCVENCLVGEMMSGAGSSGMCG